MDASAGNLRGARAEGALSLAVSPRLIAISVGAAAIGLTAFGVEDVSSWLVVVAVAAGWSSAWSP